MEHDFNLAQLKGLLRRLWTMKWPIIAAGVVCCAIATTIAIGQPNVYRGEAMLIAEFSTPSAGDVRESELDRTKEILSQVSERVYAADYLLSLMEEVGLHPDLRAEKSMERALAAARDDLTVAFLVQKKIVTVTYDYDKGERPHELAASAANHVAEYLMEKAQTSITRDSESLRDFYKMEVAAARTEVEARRTELIAFRTANDGCLPENRGSNESIISRESQTINLVRINKESVELEITDLEGQQDLARRALYEARVMSGAVADLEPRRTELAKLRAEFVQAERKYTPESEQLKLMRQRIEILQAEVNSMEESGIKNASDDDHLVQYALNRVARMDAQLKRKIEELGNVDKVVAASRATIAATQDRIRRSHELEPRYEQVKDAKERSEGRLERARQQLESAELTLRFHAGTDDLALHFNERAKPSQRPVGPRRLLMAIAGMIAGLGAGFGAAFLRFRADSTCRSREDLRPLLPSAILVSIPNVESPTLRVWLVARRVLLAGGLLVALACTVGALGIREGWWGDPATMDAVIDGIKQRIGAL